MVESKQETLKVEGCIKKNPWLIPMVKSKLFHEFCDQHTKKWRCYFCCDCMVPPLCSVCFHNKNDHEGHLMIQTFRSSHQSGVLKETISQYMDVRGIHTYTINGRSILYINQRRDDNNDNHRRRSNVSRKCVVCEWELDAASSSLFCSLQCKFRSALGSKLEELMDDKEVSEDVVKTKRRHRRKGIPHRAPFY